MESKFVVFDAFLTSKQERERIPVDCGYYIMLLTAESISSACIVNAITFSLCLVRPVSVLNKSVCYLLVPITVLLTVHEYIDRTVSALLCVCVCVLRAWWSPGELILSSSRLIYLLFLLLFITSHYKLFGNLIGHTDK